MAASQLDERATLASLGALITWPDGRAAAAAREHPVPGVGRLAEYVEWLAAAQGRWPVKPFTRPRLLTVGAAPNAVLAAADAAAVGVRTLDVPADCTEAFSAGAEAADDEVERGADLILLADPDRSPAAGIVVSALTGAEPVALLPRGAAALDTAAWIERAALLRDGGVRVAHLAGRHDDLLVAADGPPLAVSAGVVARSAARRTPLVLDGASSAAAALLCFIAEPSAARWWQFADTSTDPVHTRAVEEPGMRPVLDLGTDSGTGVAALLALAVLRMAAAVSAPAAREEPA